MNALIALADRRKWRVRYYDDEESCVAFGKNVFLRMERRPDHNSEAGDDGELPTELIINIEMRIPKRAEGALRHPDALEATLTDSLLAITQFIADMPETEGAPHQKGETEATTVVGDD